MKKILAFGAGRVAEPCLRYLLGKEEYDIFLVDQIQENLDKILQGAARGTGIRENAYERAGELIDRYNPDVVMCLLPATMNPHIAETCVAKSVDMTAASYAKDEIRALSSRAKEKGVTLLFEMGLDPGIDHMSASKTIKEIHDRGDTIDSFWSVCGSLPSMEDNTNPFGYKLSWAPSSVVNSSRREARIIKDGTVIVYPNGETYCHPSIICVDKIGWFEEYANGDSTPYKEAYGMPEVRDVYRGTIRYIGWSETIRSMLNLGVYDDVSMDFSGMSYADLILYLTNSGGVSAKEAAARFLNVPEYSAVIGRLEWLGLFDGKKIPSHCTTPKEVVADLYLEKLVYLPGEKDMVVMQHRYGISKAGTGEKKTLVSTMVVKGEISHGSAISRTTGLTLAIGTHRLLQGDVREKGVLIPTFPEIYVPVLDELEGLGYGFEECCAD